MDLKIAYIFIAALLPVFSAGVSARETAAETGQQEDTVKQFNALDYSLQRRYRPKNDPFVNEKFMDNTFIGIQGGLMDMLNRGETEFGYGPSAALHFGKWINEYNALRVSFSWNRFTRKRDIYDFHVASAGISHMFNISSYLGGYRKSRFFELSTVEGLMYNCSIGETDVRHAIGVNVGLNFNMRLSDAVDLYLEPGIILHTDAIDHSGAMNWHHYDLEYGIAAGLNVNIRSEVRHAAPPRERNGSTYLAVAAGPQMQNSDLVVNEIGIFNALGPHAYLTVGNWVTDYFAMQASAFYSTDKWIKDIDGSLRASRYLGFRVEGRFDPLMMIPGWEEKSGFSVPVLFGAECGYLYKDDRSREIGKMYLGPTAALQFRYRILDFLALYIEPRFSLAPYYIDFESDYLSSGGLRETYYDGLVNLNFGIEINISSLKEYIGGGR